MSSKVIRQLRRISQFLSFALFLYLFLQVTYLQPSWIAGDLFFRLDPLVAATAMLAGRVLIAGLAYALINLIASLVFGRAWCGWICPFGSLLEWMSPLKNKRDKSFPAAWRTVKYLFLFSMIFAAILGNQTLVFLDPITILTRSLSAAVWPAVRYLVFGAQSFLYQFEFLWPFLDWISQKLLPLIFRDVQSVFSAALPIFLFLCLLVGLNWAAERFWCRYLCPLGAFLGLTSRLSLFRRQVSESCTDCGLCARICPTGTIDAEKGYASDPAECTLCFDCLADCPVQAISFRAQIPKWQLAPSQPYDPKKRETLLALAGTLGGIALAGIEPVNKRQPKRMLRPPGAMQTDFSTLCIRCGECVRVCPTQGLQPSLLEGGWQNILTPRLMPRLGYCSFNCTACIQACPSGAIPLITLSEKQRTRIGLASINTDRCLPWAYDTICTVCEEMCPLADKAIKLVDADIVLGDGENTVLKRPVVKRELCIGCGICEYHCPAGGEAAIQVQTLPDSRNYIPGI